MARYRTIKPEFWTSAQVIECSTNARLLFIGLWNFCDDAGRHPLRPKQIKAEVFPADDFSPDDIQRMLAELSANGLISPYTVDGQEYFQVTGWHHQKIDRPQKPKCPPPPEQDSSNTRRMLAPEKSREEDKGKEKNQKRVSAPDGDYAFKGKVIRLTQADYDAWAEANPHIELRSYLVARDAYLAAQPESERKRWFISTPADLRNKNLEAKRKAKPPPRVEAIGGLRIPDH
jgi:hypothetical protein